MDSSKTSLYVALDTEEQSYLLEQRRGDLCLAALDRVKLSFAETKHGGEVAPPQMNGVAGLTDGARLDRHPHRVPRARSLGRPSEALSAPTD